MNYYEKAVNWLIGTYDTAIGTWVGGCPEIQNLYTIQGVHENDNYLFTPISDVKGSSDILGNIKQQLTFAINKIIPVNSNTAKSDNINQGDILNIMQFVNVQSVIDWVEMQDNEKKYPDIPGTKKVECLNPYPVLAGVETNGQARVMLQIRITYMKKG